MKYVFISTDSVYDASHFLIDSHRHKHLKNSHAQASAQEEQSEEKSKPKLPKNDKKQYRKSDKL